MFSTKKELKDKIKFILQNPKKQKKLENLETIKLENTLI